MSNTDAENEPASVGATSEQEAAAATETEKEEPNLDDLTTDELLAMSRAAESKANVFRGLARRDDRHQASLDAAQADMEKYAAALKERNYDTRGEVIDPTKVVIDKEGTAPTLADAAGAFAADAETANIGGIGINNSNADPEGAMEKLQSAAPGTLDVRGTSPLMSKTTTATKTSIPREPLEDA